MRAVIIAALLCAACGGGGVKPPASGEYDTERGVRVIGPALIASEIEALHQQLDDLDATARASGWQPIRHSDFVVQIVPRDTRCRDGISFVVKQEVTPGTNYDGTDYDFDGTVNGVVETCAAGRYYNSTLTPSTPRERIEVTREGLRAGRVVRYEGEHWTLWYRNRQKFYETANHPPDHPLFGEPPPTGE